MISACLRHFGFKGAPTYPSSSAAHSQQWRGRTTGTRHDSDPAMYVEATPSWSPAGTVTSHSAKNAGGVDTNIYMIVCAGEYAT